MARHSINSQCDSIATYMDGVCVKIADAYKPPDIKPPNEYYAKLIDVSKFNYDFSLEKTAQEKVC